MWTPQPGPQADAISADWCPELFYGGGKYGGKSDYLLGDFLQDVPTYGRNWRGLLLRKSLTHLEELINRSKEIYPTTGATWGVQRKEWTWPNGASLIMRYLETEQDAEIYQGHSYGWIGIDEIGQWRDQKNYKIIRTANRWGRHNLPTKRLRSTGNPGGLGHAWIRDYFVRPAPMGSQVIYEANGKRPRMFIRALPWDNKIGLANDPTYIDNLADAGSPELVRAWLEADFEIAMGAFFPEFSSRHIIEPFRIPKHWSKYCGFDWGYHSPYCALWCAISSGKDDDGREVQYPQGSIVVYRESHGTKVQNTDIAKRMLDLSSDDGDVTYIADPSIFNQESQSVAREFSDCGLVFRRGINDRVAGWSQIRKRLAARPGYLFIFGTCRYLLDTLPVLPMNEKHPEDADTEADDHAPDALRYVCMAKLLEIPYQRIENPATKGIIDISQYIREKKAMSRRPKL